MPSAFVIIGCAAVFLFILSILSARRSRRFSTAVNLKQSAQARLKNAQRKQRVLSRR